MFYSHEVLTSRKYGVATVWLVATMGTKSALKKVTRKAILDVDVQRACETIVTPDAPMALRLQSSLLYGVTKVYSQQWGYMLNDVEAAKSNMRVIISAMGTSTLDIEGATRARDHIVLQDDPNFLPDFNIAPLDLDHMETELTVSQGLQYSLLSPDNSQLTSNGTDSHLDLGGLIIPQSDSSFGRRSVGGLGHLSARGNSSAGFRMNIGGLDEDLGLAIEDDGTLRMPNEQETFPPAPEDTQSQAKKVIASSQARREDDDARSPGRDIFVQPDDDGFQRIEDDEYILAPDDAMLVPEAGEPQHPQQETSEETAEAPLRRRARPAVKIVPLDNATELRNGDLARWNSDYVVNMYEVARQKNTNKAAGVAKKNAEFWILGQVDRGPLGTFFGAELLEALTGINLRPGGQKRSRDEADPMTEDRQVRPRSEPPSNEAARGFVDDDYVLPPVDDTIEQGREAPTPLEERQHSSIMPWNQSIESRRPTGLFSAGGVPTSVSFGGASQQAGTLGRLPSRLTSASPLIGRGQPPGDLDEIQLPGSDGDVEMIGVDDFEIFGPAAQVDTQTAEQSQWQQMALDGESFHFLEFVQTNIEERDQRHGQLGGGDENAVDFDVLLPAESHSCIVAAQALLHVLALGTKNVLTVTQAEAYGAITLRVRAAQ